MDVSDFGTGGLYLLWGAAAYLLGSVSLGDLVARAAGFPIRSVGTGNPGTANVFREMGTRYAVLVLVLDAFKGAAAMLPMLVLDVSALAAAVGAAGVLTGHYLPVFWNFKGGTGMVVAIGVCFGLSPIGGLAGIPAALVALAMSRNAALSGAAFFIAAGVVGWWASSSVIPATLVALVAGSVVLKSCIQYGWLSGSTRGRTAGQAESYLPASTSVSGNPCNSHER